MISTESLTSAWIDQVAEKYNYPDKPLLEKSVRALYSYRIPKEILSCCDITKGIR